MAYRCTRCHRLWDNPLAAENEFCCTRRCGGTLCLVAPIPGAPTAADLPLSDHLPYPAALAVERLRAAIAASASAWDRVSLLKDAVEATVKSLCVYGLGMHLVAPGRTAARDEILLDLLVRPSTGHWVELLGVLCKYLRDTPQPCSALSTFFFTARGSRDEPTACYQTLLDFVPFRNDLHHGARRPEAEYEQALQQWVPRVAALLAGATFLHLYPWLIPDSQEAARVWSSAHSGQRTAGHFTTEDVGHCGFVAADGRFIHVEPFVLFLDCADCDTDRLFFYDSQKSYGSTRNKKRIYVLEYDSGHRPHRYEPIEPLEARFTAALMQRVYNAFRTKMVAIERYLKDFGTLVDGHADIIGRQFVRDRVQQFLESHQSGIFLLTGEPGIGKTALMANLVEADVGRVHFFYRHTSGLRSPDDFINCILHSLLYKYRLEATEKTADPKAQRVQLQNLLPTIAGLLKPGEQEVIIVDALDEASRAYDGATAVQVLPQELPANIYFILTSRPQNPDLHALMPRGDVERFALQADTAENKADAYAYVPHILGARCDEDTQRRIADGAEWNFLFLTLLCAAIMQDDYVPEEIAQFLVHNTTLQHWYTHYWERLESRFEDRPEHLEQINAVIGAIAAAGGPVTREQVCDTLGLTPARFDWCLRFIGQYLDVIPVTDAGIHQRGLRELVLYRLYHFSFREFVLAKVHPDLVPFHARWSYLLTHWRDLEGHERDYALRHLPRHLIEAQRWNELIALLTDLTFIEAKCAAGMVPELQTDYQTALDALPETRIAREQERAHKERITRYIKELVVYAQAWTETRIRHAADAEHLCLVDTNLLLLPDIIPSIRPWTDEEIQTHAERLMGHPTPSDRLYAFADFVTSESHNFLNITTIPGLCVQQAINYADAGPVVKAVEQIVQTGLGIPILLQHHHQRSAYDPHPALLRTLEGHTGWVFSVSLTPDGRIAVSGSMDSTIRVWDLATGQCLRTLEGHTGWVSSVSLTPDGRIAVSGSNDGSLRMWDLVTGQCLRTLKGYIGDISSVSLTPDGRLAVAGDTNRMLVWNLTTGGLLILNGDTGPISSVSLTPDGRTAVSGSKDGSLHMWDLTAGRHYLLKGNIGLVSSVSLTPDGRTAVSGSMDGSLRMWDLATGQWCPSDQPA